MEEKKQNDKKQNLALVAIVAIVAIVSIVVVFNQKSVMVVPVASQTPSVSEGQEQALAGQADYVIEDYAAEDLAGGATALIASLPRIKIVSAVPDLTEGSKRILKPAGSSPPGESMVNVYVRSIADEVPSSGDRVTHRLIEICTAATSHSDDIPHIYNITATSLVRSIVKGSVIENPDAPTEGQDKIIFKEEGNDKVRADVITYACKDGFCFKVREPLSREISQPIKIGVKSPYIYNSTSKVYKWKTFDVYVGNEQIPLCSAKVISPPKQRGTILIGGVGYSTCQFDVRVNMARASGGGAAVTILSPNGLEQWSRGREQAIRYSTRNLPFGSKVRFYLNKVDCSGDVRVGNAIGGVTTSPGTHMWTPGSGTGCAGGYKIEAVLVAADGTESATVKDFSDSPFSIIG